MRRCTAMTLLEAMISMAIFCIVLGVLFVGSTALQKSLHASEEYASSYSDQRRLIDYLARDLRRSIAITATDGSGQTIVTAGTTIDLAQNTSLILTLPGYYRSNAPGSKDYDQPQTVTATETGVDYGTNTVSSPAVQIIFRKMLAPDQHTLNFTREEAGNTEVIVTEATYLDAQVTLAADGESALIEVAFQSDYSGARPRVSTYDTVMFRNSRTTED
jgi:type II secretory pathway pseudopilin PulG